MAHRDPAIRKLIGEKSRYNQLAQQTAAERSAIAKKSADTRRRQLEDQIDPERKLDPEERARRIYYAVRAEMAEKSLKAVKSRREKLAAKRAAEANAELDALLTAEAGVA